MAMKNNLIGTYSLFYQSMYFILVSCALVFLILILSNRSKKHIRIRYIILSGIVMIGLMFIRFMTSLVFTDEPAKVLYFLNLLCVILILFVQLIYYAKKYSIILFVTIIAIFATGFDFFSGSEVEQLQISSNYELLMYYFLFVLSSLSIYDIYQCYKNQETMYDANDKHLHSIGKYQLYESILLNFGFLLALSLYIYSLHNKTQLPLGDFGLIIYIMLIHITYLYFMPQVKIPIGYGHIISNMMDTVIVLDDKNTLLYSNDTAIKELFNFENTIDFNQMSSYLVNQPCHTRAVEEHQIRLDFRMNNEERKVLQVSKQSIRRKNKVIGSIININDCSHLESMIEDKERQKNDLDSLKLELTKYNQTSNYLLAENQRNRLMMDVQNELGHYMAELANHINATLHIIKDESMSPHQKQPLVHENIEAGISMAKGNLSKIRETVKKYRSSYKD
jgi:hypothetical protein